MKCPKCNTEMRIKSTDYVVNEGKLFSRQILVCRYKECPNFNKDTKTLYEPLTVTEDLEAEVQED